jgi:CBS domain-containing protein
MWWPAIGGLVIGIGGVIFPQALGVGYDTIAQLVQGHITTSVIAGILIVKSIIWAVALGSGTSGGVLAPLLMMGGALGGIEAMFLPNEGAGFWSLISMGAILGGTMRSPFTGVIFAIELTHDFNVMLPLLVASVIAHAFTVLVLKRSILTEKVARRGFHLSREYAVDPLEIQFVREVMRTKLVVFPEHNLLNDIVPQFRRNHGPQGQHLYPVVDQDRRLIGVITRKHILKLADEGGRGTATMSELSRKDPVLAYTDEPLRAVVYRMAEKGVTRLPVLDRGPSRRIAGMVSLEDLLMARSRNLTEERARERVLRLRLPFQHKPEAV